MCVLWLVVSNVMARGGNGTPKKIIIPVSDAGSGREGRTDGRTVASVGRRLTWKEKRSRLKKRKKRTINHSFIERGLKGEGWDTMAPKVSWE